MSEQLMTESIPRTSPGRTYVYKVVLIGDGAVGKTSLRRKYMGEGFQVEYLNTVGADFAYYSEKIGNNIYKWSIWDLAGQPKFENVRPMFYQGALGALVCFDSTRVQTFRNLDKWVDELVRNTYSEGTPIVVVATKMDIYDSNAEGHVNFDEVEEYVKKLQERFKNRFDVGMIKTSALKGTNIKEAFNMLREAIIKWHENN